MVGHSDDSLLYTVAHGSIQQSNLAMQELDNRKNQLVLSKNKQVIYYRILDHLRDRANPLTATKLMESLNSDKDFKELPISKVEISLYQMKIMKLVRKSGAAWIDVRGGARRY